MSLRNKVVGSFAVLATVGVLGLATSAAQPTSIPVAPGTQALITCDTTMQIAPQSPQSILVDCAAESSTSVSTAQVTDTPTLEPTSTGVPTTTSTAVPPTNTPVPPTSTPLLPTSTPPPGGQVGIWLSPDEVAALPTTGAAWTAVLNAANGSWGTADLSNLNSNHDVLTLSGALVYARQGSTSMRDKVEDAIMSAIGTEDGGRTLELSRNVVSYVIAADLIDFASTDPTREMQFRSWLASVRLETLDGRTIISTHEERPNNWGTMAGAARVAIARYLGDTGDLEDAADVFHGWLGNRDVYAGFDYGELGWQCTPSEPVGVNPQGCTKEGNNIDGVLPDDQRRTGGFAWPAPKGSYPHEALQGSFVQAQLLHRAGYPAWEWEDQALRRAYVWLYTINQNPASGDDSGYPFLVNSVYGTTFAVGSSPHSSGKNMCCLSWTHGS